MLSCKIKTKNGEIPKADDKGENVIVARDININNRRTFMKRRDSITICSLGYVLLLIMRINYHRSSDKIILNSQTEIHVGIKSL